MALAAAAVGPAWLAKQGLDWWQTFTDDQLLSCIGVEAPAAHRTLCIPGWQHDVGTVHERARQFTGDVQHSRLDIWQPAGLLRPAADVQPSALQLVVQWFSRLAALHRTTPTTGRLPVTQSNCNDNTGMFKLCPTRLEEVSVSGKLS